MAYVSMFGVTRCMSTQNGFSPNLLLNYSPMRCLHSTNAWLIKPIKFTTDIMIPLGVGGWAVGVKCLADKKVAVAGFLQRKMG